jgi:hypothetical protein
MGSGEVNAGVLWGNLGKGYNLEDPGIDGRIILIWIFQKCYWDMECIDLARVRAGGGLL